MTRKEKQAAKALDDMIDAIYRKNCNGIQINMMDISKVFEEGRRAFRANEDVEKAVVAFVQTIRKN